MTENKNNNNKLSSLGERSSLKLKDETRSKRDSLLCFNNLNNKAMQKEGLINGYASKKFDVKNSSNSIAFSKDQTKSREIDKRYDVYGNLIIHGGKHKISFIDRVSKNNIVDVIKIENYKEYNKMEEVAPSSGNGCCLII